MKSQNTRDHYVYIWRLETTKEVFYVGKGKNGRYKNTTKRSDEFKIVLQNNPCEVVILQKHLTNSEACKLEMLLIDYYRKYKHYNLLNKTKGGESGNYYVEWTEDKKEYLRLQKGERNPNFGHKWTEEMKKVARERASSSGRYKKENNPKAQKIRCIETGEEFSCIAYAMDKYNVKHGSSFTIALDNPNRTAAGLHWVRCET